MNTRMERLIPDAEYGTVVADELAEQFRAAERRAAIAAVAAEALARIVAAIARAKGEQP